MNMDKKIKQIKRLQEEKDRRKKVEDEAICLIEQGRTEEAYELLQTLDDHIAEEIIKEADCTEETPEKAGVSCRQLHRPADRSSRHMTGRIRTRVVIGAFRDTQGIAGYSRVSQGTAVFVRVTQRRKDTGL